MKFKELMENVLNEYVSEKEKVKLIRTILKDEYGLTNRDVGVSMFYKKIRIEIRSEKSYVLYHEIFNLDKDEKTLFLFKDSQYKDNIEIFLDRLFEEKLGYKMLNHIKKNSPDSFLDENDENEIKLKIFGYEYIKKGDIYTVKSKHSDLDDYKGDLIRSLLYIMKTMKKITKNEKELKRELKKIN